MMKSFFNIGHIPAVIWGEPADRVVIATHGYLSSKTDKPIELLARAASRKNYQVLSFDLPEHGNRRCESSPCSVRVCVADLQIIMQYARPNWKSISMFGNSMGAYFCLTACRAEVIEKFFLLAPVVDMARIITNNMAAHQITPAHLYEEQRIITSSSPPINWDCYRYAKDNPVQTINAPVYILYGDKDDVCEPEIIYKFVKKFNCDIEIMENSEHYFRTPEQMRAYEKWLEKVI